MHLTREDGWIDEDVLRHIGPGTRGPSSLRTISPLRYHLSPVDGALTQPIAR